MGGVTFCLLSSSVYIINDIKDKSKDFFHPIKCHRPIASGAISTKKAFILASLLFVISISMNFAIFSFEPTLLLIIYFVLNVAYSYGLKDIPILDITILVSGFLIRVFYGGLIVNVRISNWLYLTVMAMSFYFALGKRRNELKHISEGDTRFVLKYYPASFLDKFMYVCLGLGNAFYSLWCVNSRYGRNYLIFTAPLVFLITMKYSLDIENNADGDPVEVILNDKILLALCILYFVTTLAVLYL